ncbi:hypothetical protein [Paracoccus sp. MKU1]|uniref:hypothetical protein n=1 Tax=Paracoccus sp. MKU1 TaxID=1745182 RepID=UPI0007190A2B|nr:hypothetical protein [Paracoccus sp. MKU1]KRW94315.1 hypothetical protein AQY21_20515 [Paracoccus sp. MKU1]
MAYGFLIKNKNNEVVIDDQSASLQVWKQVTLTGTAIGVGSYRYGKTNNNFMGMPFIYLPGVGDWVAYDPQYGYISNRTTLRITTARAVRDMSGVPAEPYGMEVYDQNGLITFSTARDLVAVIDTYMVDPGNIVNIPTTARDFYIGTASLSYEQFSSSSFFQDGHGIERTSNGIKCRYVDLGDTLAPYGELEPYPFLCLGAVIV